jgi:hypothetical protein
MLAIVLILKRDFRNTILDYPNTLQKQLTGRIAIRHHFPAVRKPVRRKYALRIRKAENILSG